MTVALKLFSLLHHGFNGCSSAALLTAGPFLGFSVFYTPLWYNTLRHVCVRVRSDPCFCSVIDSPVSTSVMFWSLADRLTQFAINTPSSRLEALPDGAGTICLADASLLTD